MLDLLHYSDQLIFEEQDGKKLIFCPIRNRFLVMQPEELVRQIFMLYLQQSLGYKQAKIAVEKGLRIHGKMRRYDILVFDKSINPLILVECKAPHVPINQDVMDQIGHYNLPLKAEFLVLTNGHQNIFCQLSESGNAYEYIDQLPIQTNG